MSEPVYDAVVVGGGPAGATAATDLAEAGRSVLLLDRMGRTKPCGGAIPPRLIKDYAIPDSLLVAKINSARMVSPAAREVDMPIDGGFVGMVDRGPFDEWLRARAVRHGAQRLDATYTHADAEARGLVRVHFTSRAGGTTETVATSVLARCLIGADGAASLVAKHHLPAAAAARNVAAYHEIVRTPAMAGGLAFDGSRCDVWYQGVISPDFYGWVFPHGETTSIGTGSARRGYSLRQGVSRLRASAGLTGAETIRREGAPIPMKPLRRWDDGRAIVVVGDAAGVVAPASGEGIYYAMASGRIAAEAVDTFLASGDRRELQAIRQRFMAEYGRTFWVLGLMQYFWYSSDARRERFVSMCADPDVQRLTWQSYMHKRLVRSDPLAHLRIFLKDTAHLLGLTRA
jgi:geranylgeranyl diphosphate/geranylgeranyl-bacteriochlorophyllide a reductase